MTPIASAISRSRAPGVGFEVEQDQPHRQRPAGPSQGVVEGPADAAGGLAQVQADGGAGWSHAKSIELKRIEVKPFDF